MMATCPDGHQSGATDYCDECGLSMSGPVHSGTGGTGGPGAVPGDGGSGASPYGAAGEPCPNCLLPRQAGDTFCEGCGFPFDQEQSGQTLDASDLDIEAEIRRAEEARRKSEEAQRTAEEARRKAEEEKRALAKGPVEAPNPVQGVFGNGGQQTGAQTGTQTGGPSTPNGGGAPAAVQWIAIASADRAYYDAVVAEGEIDANAYPFPPYCPERQFELKGDTVRIGRSGKRGNVDIDLTGPPTDPGVSHLHAVLQQRPDGGWAVVDLESMNGTVLNDDTAPIPPNQAFPVEAGHRIHVGVWTTLTLIQLG